MSTATVTASILAVVFLWAGAAKLFDTFGTESTAIEFGLPPRYASLVSRSLPVLELGIAVLLLLPPTRVAAAMAASALLAAFAVLIARALRAGKHLSCHCFGRARSDEATPLTVARNVLLMLLAAVVVVDPVTSGAISQLLAKRGLVVVAGAASIVAICLLAVQSWLVLALARQVSMLAARLDAVESTPAEHYRPTPARLVLGHTLPPIDVFRSDGSPVPAAEMAGRDQTLLLLLSTGCGPCREIMDLHLDNWRRILAGHAVIQPLVIGETSLPDALRTASASVTRLGLLGTPCGVLLGAGGVVLQEPAYGIVAIERLAAEIARRLPVAMTADGR